MDFTGKRVVVTGAAGIFGGWIATAFARAGAVLCLSDIRRERLDALPAKLGVDPATTLLHATELREEASINALAALIGEQWGAPDIVVNNAGIYPRTGILLDLDIGEWDRMMDVNVRAPFLVTRALARLMIAQGVQGAIVNIGSGASRQMRIGSVPYCTSKTALERLTKGQALELAPHRIRVNVVEPGFAPGSEVSPLPDAICREDEGAHSARAHERARAHAERGAVPLLGERVLHHRRRARGRWRQLDRHLRAVPLRPRCGSSSMARIPRPSPRGSRRCSRCRQRSPCCRWR